MNTKQHIALTDTLVIVLELPGAYNEEDYWVLPNGQALRNLAELLGSGSQAFVFTGAPFGNPDNHRRDYHWHELFEDILDAAWSDDRERVPAIHVECGFQGKGHGPSVLASERVFGRQVEHFGDEELAPTPIRLFSSDAWNEPPSTILSDARGRAIMEYLDKPGAITVAKPNEHFDARLPVWFERAGVTSQHYERIAVIEDWDGNTPIVESLTELQ